MFNHVFCVACGAVYSGTGCRPAGTEEEPPLTHQGADVGGSGDVQVPILLQGIFRSQIMRMCILWPEI
jgi:hypothetical protein